MAKMLFRLPKAANVFENPSADEVKDLAAQMPNAKLTQYGNVNVQTEVVSRSKRSTFIVTRDGNNVILPNSELLRQEVLNFSKGRMSAKVSEFQETYEFSRIGRGSRLWYFAGGGGLAGMLLGM